MPEVIGEGEIVLSTRNQEALAAFEQTQRAGEQTTTYLEKLYAREEAMKVIRAERAAEKAAKAKEREAAREVKAGERAAAQAEKQRNREAMAAEKAAAREAKAAEKARARETAAAEKAAKRQEKLDAELAAKRAKLQTFSGRAQQIQRSPVISELETVASLFTQVGGAASQAGILVSSAIRPVALLTAGVGAAGVAAAAFPAAAGVAALGAKKVADAAVEARDRLKEMGIAVDKTASDKLDSYAAATRDLGIAMDQVKIAMGSEIAEELTVFIRIVGTNTKAMWEWAQTISHVADVTTDLISFGLKPAWEIIGGKLYESLTKTTRATIAAADAARKHTDELKKASAAAAKLNNDLEREAQEDEAAGKAERIRQEAEAIRRAAEVEAAAAAESLRQRTEALGMIDREIVAIEEQRQATLRLAGYVRDLTTLYDDQQEVIADIGVMVEATTTKMQSATDDYAGSWEQVGDSIEEALGRPEVQAAIQGLNEMLTATQDILGMISEAQEEAAAAWKDRLDESVANERKANAELSSLRKKLSEEGNAQSRKAIQNQIDELEADRKVMTERRVRRQEEFDQHAKLARRAWIGEQVGAVTQAAMNTGLAVTLALATIPPPFGYVAAAGAAAAGAAEIAAIASKKPPEFPMGQSAPWANSPDHSILAAIQPNERIVTSRGARDDDEIRRMNEGRGRGGENIFILQANGRDIAAMSSKRGRVRVDPRAGKTTRRRGR